MLILILIGAACFGQAARIKEPSFVPMSPEVMAQGGSFVAAAHGYNSFFYNPAGLAREFGSFTLATVNGWVYARPDRVINSLEGIQGLTGGGEESMFAALDIINDQATSGGFGVGASGGFGVAGSGLGIGAVFVVDSYIYGPTLFGVEGDLHATGALVLGYALRFDLLGIDISVGGDVRPMARLHGPITNENIGDLLSVLTGGSADESALPDALNNIKALYGTGVAFDVGAIVEITPFTVGISIRDLFGTTLTYNSSGLMDFAEYVTSTGEIPVGTPEAGTYMIPMEISAGAMFHPDMGFFQYIFDPIIHVDLVDPIGVFQEERSPWTLLHIGAEARLLSIFAVRAGLNQGYITIGGGVKLLFLEAHAAIFSRELGKHIGDRPNAGVTLEAAIRF